MTAHSPVLHWMRYMDSVIFNVSLALVFAEFPQPAFVEFHRVSVAVDS
jgi:hypothetical protein